MSNKTRLTWGDIFDGTNVLNLESKNSKVHDFFKYESSDISLEPNQVQILKNLSELTDIIMKLDKKDKNKIFSIGFVKTLHYLIYKDGALPIDALKLGIEPGEYHDKDVSRLDYYQSGLGLDLSNKKFDQGLIDMLLELKEHKESDKVLILHTILNGFSKNKAFYGNDVISIVYANIVLGIYGHELTPINVDSPIYEDNLYDTIENCTVLLSRPHRYKGVSGLLKAKFFS